MISQFQRWTGPAENDPALDPQTAVLLFAEAPGQSGDLPRYRLVGWAAAEDAELGAPIVVEGDGRAFITLPRTHRGSAGMTSDVVLFGAADSAEWREINVSDWFADLQRRLPHGLYGKPAFSLDLLGMRASTAIARAADPNCCPSGGTAEVRFVLRDDTLVIDSLVLRHPEPTPPPGACAANVKGKAR